MRSEHRAGTNARSVVRGGAVGLALVLALAGCGGEGVTLPTVTRSDGTVITPSISVPSRTGDQSTEEAEATTDAPEPTTEEPQPTTEEPEPTTEEPQATTEEPEPTTEASPEAAGQPDAADDAGQPAWVWWLLGLLALGLVLVFAVLVPRSRRRREWDEEFASAEREAAWFARDLLPRLWMAATPDLWAGGWQVSADRVLANEDQLTRLEASAPDDQRRSRALSLRDGVRSARRGVEQAVASPGVGASADDLRFLAHQLEASLGQGGMPPSTGQV
ncbi:MAG: hypothetical protein WBL35_01810 [Ornithinibacter sp.]